eukprot:g77878.t1
MIVFKAAGSHSKQMLWRDTLQILLCASRKACGKRKLYVICWRCGPIARKARDVWLIARKARDVWLL